MAASAPIARSFVFACSKADSSRTQHGMGVGHNVQILNQHIAAVVDEYGVPGGPLDTACGRNYTVGSISNFVASAGGKDSPDPRRSVFDVFTERGVKPRLALCIRDCLHRSRKVPRVDERTSQVRRGGKPHQCWR